ncbi:UDP-N-acetylmuramoyl-tripeptide--D-alanyl-D-alanine ligase [Patescibacteria group bacterium]|nr:UDP-N-acetylmuramoyl-tripeptide--D-alanyl-D-alanine ligase [Patescibacteria group bacterium]MBU1895355.1 UDP-N-acetylmuramoyl-tripeptide--D-alanyl-D-alanine ligase [Patescibacteria group bacterium]
MISSFNIIILLLWFVSAGIGYVEFCYIWQLKHYRLDRFKDFLSTEQGRSYWASYSLLWRSTAALIVFFWPINSIPTLKYALVLFFAIDILVQFIRYLKGRIKIPVRTKRVFILVLGAMFFEGGIFLLTHDWSLLFFLIILRFFIMSFFVRLTQLPIEYLKKYFIKKATNKLGQYENLTIIGITGSYGKTTVKEFLSHLLSGEFSVIKTPEHVNTEIGIAKFILRTDFTTTNIFVVEMGAYRRGEIKIICDMVHPKIGILTGINEQHLSLFGSLDDIKSAKYELLQSLPKDGLAVINMDTAYVDSLISSIKAPIKTYGVDESLNPNVLLHKIKSTDKGIYVEVTIDGEVNTKIVPITGEHLVMNLGACSLVAMHLDMKEELYMGQMVTIKNPENTMKQYIFGKATIIDDSYNANPAGFLGALETLALFPSYKRRIVITRGMLELGEESYTLHEKIGGAIAYRADELVIISKDSEEPLRNGVGNKFNTTIQVITEPEKLLEYLLEHRKTDCVILLENKLLAGVYDSIIKFFQEIK